MSLGPIIGIKSGDEAPSNSQLLDLVGRDVLQIIAPTVMNSGRLYSYALKNLSTDYRLLQDINCSNVLIYSVQKAFKT